MGRFEDERDTIVDDDILSLWMDLGDRERKVLINFMTRLLAGQKAYGPLTPYKKNWKREAKEEALDMAVYLCAALEDDK